MCHAFSCVCTQKHSELAHMVLTIFLPCITSCDDDLYDLFARWCKQGVLCAQNPSWGQTCLGSESACRAVWTDMQHEPMYACTLQSLGTLRCQELAAVVLTTSIFCHLCIVQSINPTVQQQQFVSSIRQDFQGGRAILSLHSSVQAALPNSTLQ